MFGRGGKDCVRPEEDIVGHKRNFKYPHTLWARVTQTHNHEHSRMLHHRSLERICVDPSDDEGRHHVDPVNDNFKILPYSVVVDEMPPTPRRQSSYHALDDDDDEDDVR